MREERKRIIKKREMTPFDTKMVAKNLWKTEEKKEKKVFEKKGVNGVKRCLDIQKVEKTNWHRRYL